MKRFLSVLLALWGVPVLAVMILRLDSNENQSARSAEPKWARVGVAVDDGQQLANIHVTWSEPRIVVAPRPGVVGALAVDVGSEVTNGAVLGTVSGSEVIAHVGVTPFYRQLTVGDSGDDVVQLAALLLAAGVIDDADASGAVVTPAIARGVGRLQVRLRVEADSIFRPEYVTFAGTQPSSVVSVATQIGSNLVAGSPLINLLEAPKSISLEPLGAGQRKAMVAKAPIVVESPGAGEIALGSVVPDTADSSKLSAALGLVPGTEPSPVLIRLAKARKIATVPASAIVSGGDDSCVWVRRDGKAHSIKVVAAEASLDPGIVAVQPELAAENVLVNPSGSGYDSCTPGS